MAVSKSVVGLTSIVSAWIVTRVAVHHAYPTPGMTPDDIWHSMSPALKAVVFCAFLLFSYGWWTLIRLLVRRLGGR